MCGGLYGYGEQGTFRVPANLEPLWPLFGWNDSVRFGYYSGSRYYVYALCYPSGLPFYLGKGTGQRMRQHYKNAINDKYKPHGEKERIILSLHERNESERYHFFALCDDEGEAWQIEQHYIDKWGIRADSGMLCNLARGSNQGVKIEQMELVTAEIVHDDSQPRPVYYPLELRKGPADPSQLCWCPVCNNQCRVPCELYMVSVQCPYCAHFFRPIADVKMRGAYCFYNLRTQSYGGSGSGTPLHKELLDYLERNNLPKRP